MTEGTMGFLFFPMGMVAVIFYLAYVDAFKLFILQLSGFITTVLIFIITEKHIVLRLGPQVNFDDHRGLIILTNMIISLINIQYVSVLYKRDQEQTRAVMKYNNTHDQLTGLYNRRFFYEEMNNALKTTHTYSIAMIDIDGFKSINDTYGHKFGDVALTSLASLLMENVSEKDIVVRWGGEEFIIYMPDTSESQALQNLTTILNKVEKNQITIDNTTIHFTVTMGLSVSDNISNYEKVINDADEKLYHGKRHGKNRIISSL